MFCFTVDPEEFITVLFQKVLCIEPLLKLRYKPELLSIKYLPIVPFVCEISPTEIVFLFRSREETCQGAYTFQIFLEKEQMGQMPTVQQLLDTSCLSGGLKFEEVSALFKKQRHSGLLQNVTLILPSQCCPTGAVLSNGSDAKVWKQV